MWLGTGHVLQQMDIGDIQHVTLESLDSQLLLSDHIAVICRARFYQLRQIRPAIQSLTSDAAITIVPAFIACRLDWCNSLLYGVPENLLRKVLSVQNAAARLAYLPTHGAVTTSLRCCDNFTGCRSKDEWSLRLRVFFTNRLL